MPLNWGLAARRPWQPLWIDWRADQLQLDRDSYRGSRDKLDVDRRLRGDAEREAQLPVREGDSQEQIPMGIA